MKKTTTMTKLVTAALLTFLALTAATTFAIPATASSTPDDATPAAVALAAATPVKLKVRCDGVDFASLSMQEATQAGHALATSYDTVHAHDDSSLTHLRYHGALSDSDGSSSTVSEAPPLQRHKKKYTGEWSGTWDCNSDSDSNNCPETDEASDTAAWENELVATLLLSNNNEGGAFTNIRNCQIAMEAASYDSALAPNVDIRFRCNDKKAFRHVTIAQGTFLAHSMQAAFQKVHAETDDSLLESVFFHKAPKSNSFVSNDHPPLPSDDPVGLGFLPNFSTWWKWFSGSFDCRLCVDDDLLLFVSHDNVAAWEAEFVVLLNQGPHTKFHGINHCDIVLEPHTLAAEEEEDGEPEEPGLRGAGGGGGVKME